MHSCFYNVDCIKVYKKKHEDMDYSGFVAFKCTLPTIK